MNQRISKWLAGGMVGVLLLSSVACSTGTVQIKQAEIGELKTETQIVELQGAESATVEVDMGVGGLTIDSGASALMDAEFISNVPSWKNPEVEYKVSGGVGNLVVRAPENHDMPADGFRYDWNLKLNDEIPMDLTLNLGVGEPKLKLGGLTLRDVRIVGGAGNLSVDLADSKSLDELNIVAGVGNTEMDLRGQWEKDVEVNFQGGVGEATLTLPQDIGVRVEVTEGLGKISVSGLNRDGDTYVNDQYGKSPVTLTIKVTVGVGEITLDGGE